MQNNLNQDSYISETRETYKTRKYKSVIKERYLSRKESLMYFLNENEIELSDELQEVINSDRDIPSFMSRHSNKRYNRFPFNVNLLGDEILEELKYEIRHDFSLLETKLITNDYQSNLFVIDQLKSELLTCRSFDIIVSFIRGSGLNMLISTLKILNEMGIKGRVITSTYMNVTEPKALRILNDLENIDVKVYQHRKMTDSFHTKSYIFYRDQNLSSVIIGSSNISAAALKTGEEWNVRTYERASDAVFEHTSIKFNRLWDSDRVVPLTSKFITKYENFIESNHVIKPISKSFNVNQDEEGFRPNSMQKTAISNLIQSIDNGHKRGMAIAATGTGKTFLAALAAERLDPERVLFVAHRNELLDSGLKTFKTVFKGEDTLYSKYKASDRTMSKFTFASIQTLVNDIDKIDSRQFDLIIIDEFHHATASNYMKVINHFEPEFLLGLTATPERTDGGDIFELAEHNIIVDVRLKDALEGELLVPFQYYGISDDTIDLSKTEKISSQALTKLLNSNRRVDFIISKMKEYALSGQRKAIGFCQSIDHANFMYKSFLDKGFHCEVLTGDNTDEERRDVINRLESDDDPLEIIFTVDLFNEGVDIPSVNLILFLRPTESAIIFTQQLGRGLRKFDGKEYLTVLDFVTNDRNNYLIPIALSGDRQVRNKDSTSSKTRTGIKTNSPEIHIELDYKTKHKILESISQTKFYTAVNIKNEAKEFLQYIRRETSQSDRNLKITDFYKYDEAPNIYMMFNKTYKNIHKLNVAIKECSELDEKIVSNKLLNKVFNEITNLIPVLRLYDYIVFIEILKGQKVDVNFIEQKVKEYYSISLNEQAHQKIRYSIDRIELMLNKTSQWYNMSFEQIVSLFSQDENLVKLLDQYLDYGMYSYRKRFDVQKLNEEMELTLHEEYDRKSVGALVGYDKNIDAWREGVHAYNGHYYLFVNLKKDETNVEEHLMYDDYFINEELFHWQSQNQTDQTSKRGKDLIFHKERNIQIHLFVRKANNEEGITLPFNYMGEVEVVSYSGNKPISFEWKLKQRIPQNLLDEFLYL